MRLPFTGVTLTDKEAKAKSIMFIQTEGTPNPATLKFLPGCDVMVTGGANFTSAEMAARSRKPRP